MRQTIKFMLLLICVTLVFSGCREKKGEDGQGRLTICFTFQDLETEFWVAGHQVIVETLQKRNVRVIERNANQDANRQFEQVRNAIVQRVDGIIMIPQDGESATTIIGEANKAGIPIAVFNRPPSSTQNPALVVVADNEAIAEQAVDFMVEEAVKLGRKVTPLIMVGDMGDRNALQRRVGFYKAIEKRPEIFNRAIEVPTNWDSATALANLEAALQANPNVDFIFTSSDFMYPQIRAVLEPLGKWKQRGEPAHVILGGLDGDSTAYRLMEAGYVDATGVQNLFWEADVLIEALLNAIEKGEKTPNQWMHDTGFVLTQENMETHKEKMWGYALIEN